MNEIINTYKIDQFGNLKIIDTNDKYSGVYIIYNLNNNKYYIGSSQNIYKRYKRHYNDLINGNHYNVYLQRSYNKIFDKDKFLFLVLEQVENIDMLINREQYWLDKTQCHDSSIGYNINPIAGRPPHLAITEETRIKLKNSHLNKKASEQTKKKMSESRKKYVYQYSLNGEFIKEYKGIISLKEYNFNPDVVYDCCLDGFGTHKGYQWSYTKCQNIGKVTHNKNFPVYQIDKSGNIINEWNNTREIADYYNCNINSISRCCNGERKTYKNFIWRFIKDYNNDEIFNLEIKRNSQYNSILQYDLKGNLIKIWNNVSDICKELNYNNSAIYQCIKNIKPQYKGYKWVLNN